MSDQTLKAELSEELVLFLQQQGYSHILQVEDGHIQYSSGADTDDYHLLPLKPNDIRVISKEFEFFIFPIHSDEIQLMSEGVDALRFLIELPVNVYNQYLTDSINTSGTNK